MLWRLSGGAMRALRLNRLDNGNLIDREKEEAGLGQENREGKRTLIEWKTSLDSIAEGRRHFGWNWACVDDSHNGGASTITWQCVERHVWDGKEGTFS
ncbi:hypothetical protein B296_00034200 [Ensete ventricosum]|uniref:Uncharacterized protein n=1 Tax=Ensete ventricosum TaxID=4639 RepID=A0A426ZXB2_ENSVE|nr:hypothetical protein B296_00034200 [Ensete ventricosum]